MLRWALIGLLLLHGLIHLMGFAKAFGYAARDERSHGDWDFTCYERSID